MRKLKHELGIGMDQMSLELFKFITRLHYCAPGDSVMDSNLEQGCNWGEHEMDYILFIRVSDIEIDFNLMCADRKMLMWN